MIIQKKMVKQYMSLMNELNDELLKQVSGGTEEASDDPRFEILFEMLNNLRVQFKGYDVVLSRIIRDAELSLAAGNTYESIRDDVFYSLMQIPGVVVYGNLLDYSSLL